METPSTGFMKDDLTFSGWVMLRLHPKMYDWRDWVLSVCNDNKDMHIKPEFDCHVTLVGGVHRDDVMRYYKNGAFPLEIGGVITAENFISYFDNDMTAAKFAVKDSVSVSDLWEYRNEVFAQCRCIEHYPNFQPHITVGYLKKGERLPESLRMQTPHEFYIESISFSITQDNGQTLEW